jgi:hypothetical protein
MEQKKAFTVTGIIRTAVKVITSPATFYREMPKSIGFTVPFTFMVMMGLVNGLVTAALGLFGMTSNPIFSTGVTMVSLVLYPFTSLSPTPILSTGMAIASIMFYPLAYAVLGFGGAGLVYAVWKILGSSETFETAYGCIAYLSAFMPITTLLLVIPYWGLIICIALLTYLYVLISREVHVIKAAKAWGVFGLIGIVLFFMGLGADIRVQEYNKKMADMKTDHSASVDHNSR